MGTSSARRAPTTRLWRRAKGAATRYLAPEGGVGLEAREVVARYLSALGEEAGPGSQGLSAVFRLTRKTAHNLGVFIGQAASQGWKAACKSYGLQEEAGQPRDMAVLGLAGALLDDDGSLEGAVGRSSLAAVLREIGPDREAGAVEVVTQFLAESLYQRLILDLGEPLEAASLSCNHWRQGLEGLKTHIAKIAAVETGIEPPRPEQWRGWPGWNWVTLALESTLRRLLDSSSPRKRRPSEGEDG